jgi:integrase
MDPFCVSSADFSLRRVDPGRFADAGRDLAETFHVGAYFRLCLLTAQRRSEVLYMPWSEFDLKAGWWVIPGERTKNKRRHAIPLGSQTLAILQALRDAAPDSTMVFPNIRNLENIIEKLKQVGVNPRPHDLRKAACGKLGRRELDDFVGPVVGDPEVPSRVEDALLRELDA